MVMKDSWNVSFTAQMGKDNATRKEITFKRLQNQLQIVWVYPIYILS